eukprot:11342421-Alexandrium_andersonii.AAC.1
MPRKWAKWCAYVRSVNRALQQDSPQRPLQTTRDSHRRERDLLVVFPGVKWRVFLRGLERSLGRAIAGLRRGRLTSLQWGA